MEQTEPWTVWDDIFTVLGLIGLVIIAVPVLVVAVVGDTILDIKQRVKRRFV